MILARSVRHLKQQETLSLSREMMRNTDRAMSNIEATPEDLTCSGGCMKAYKAIYECNNNGWECWE
ncbi:hypothetical protein GBA52_029159 [Prunus armeniaca]|nr:hypothetical protein GBA52_029159 [Prunus armeniaca]